MILGHSAAQYEWLGFDLTSSILWRSEHRLLDAKPRFQPTEIGLSGSEMSKRVLSRRLHGAEICLHDVEIDLRNTEAPFRRPEIQSGDAETAFYEGNGSLFELTV